MCKTSIEISYFYNYFFYRAHLANNGHFIDNNNNNNDDNATNVFLTQTVNPTQNESPSESRSSTSTSSVPKLPQITSTSTT